MKALSASISFRIKCAFLSVNRSINQKLDFKVILQLITKPKLQLPFKSKNANKTLFHSQMAESPHSWLTNMLEKEVNHLEVLDKNLS